jgi:hypothetical protein
LLSKFRGIIFFMKRIKLILSSIRNNLDNNTRLRWLLNIGIIGLLAGLLLSSDAWSTERTLPFSPIMSTLEMSSGAHDALFLIVIITLVLCLFRFRMRNHLMTIGLISLLLLILLDITRLQPWILHYAAILIFFSSFIHKKHLSETKVLDAARLIIGGIYFWSGIQKINPRFFSEIFPWFTQHLASPFGEPGLAVALALGLFVPYIELGFALGFFSKRFRKVALAGSLGMLIIIMASIGPTGHNWNIPVWPWNIAIFSMVIILFWGENFSLSEFISRIRHSSLAWIVIAVFWIMPAGNLVGLTDHYLSWSLYSGTVPEASILGNQEFLTTLSPAAYNGELLFGNWAIENFNLVPYPQNRVFIDIFERLCNDNQAQPMTLLIQSNKSGTTPPANQTRYKCNEVK